MIDEGYELAKQNYYKMQLNYQKLIIYSVKNIIVFE